MVNFFAVSLHFLVQYALKLDSLDDISINGCVIWLLYCLQNLFIILLRLNPHSFQSILRESTQVHLFGKYNWVSFIYGVNMNVLYSYSNFTLIKVYTLKQLPQQHQCKSILIIAVLAVVSFVKSHSHATTIDLPTFDLKIRTLSSRQFQERLCFTH